MTLAGLLILLGSAFIHVVTHIALKRSRDRTAFVWWMLLFSGVLFAPVLLFAWHPFAWQGWALLIASAVFEAGYFYAIAKAYHGAYVEALSTLVDENQDPAVDGLTDDVAGPDEEDRKLVKALAKRFDSKAYMKEIDIEKFKAEGTTEELLLPIFVNCS